MKISFRLGITLVMISLASCSTTPSSGGDSASLSPPITDRTFYLPVLLFETNGVAIPDDPKIWSDFELFPPGYLSPALAESLPLYGGQAGIELRGHQSQSFPKKQYGIELWDEEGEGTDAELLGLPEESDFVVNGTYSDKTLLRNVFAYELSRQMGHYASRYRWVEVVIHEHAEPLNLHSDHRGIYALLEKIKRGSERVAITKLTSSQNSMPEISGGYILKTDRVDPGDLSFTTSEGTIYIIEYPKASQVTAQQSAWLQDYLEDFEQSMLADPPGYDDFIETDTFIDFFLLNELFKNIDAYRLSSFMHKDRLGKLRMGPVWDFDIAAGNCDYYNAWEPEGWILGAIPPDAQHQQPFWWALLFEDANFQTQLRMRWQTLRQDIFSQPALNALIDALASELGPAVGENFQTWPILGVDIWPNYFVGDTYGEELQYLKDWLALRTLWMDAALSP